MKFVLSILSLCIILQGAYAPPVSPDKKDEVVDGDDLMQYTEYHRYLKEVVQALESDPEFRDRLEKADEDDVRSGKIAEQLDFVNHNVRTKLDEIKRREMERLRHLATKKFELTNNLDLDSKVSSEHLDHNNPHTFEIEDLKKLIQKTTADLEAADKQRREQFKEYEMQKEFEKHQKLEELDDKQKKEYLENVKKEEEAKKHHQPQLHHPGSKQQLEEVWDKQDHMDQQFDPKAFFMMHDVDGNGVWDADEVKALFIKELDKIYSPNGPNKDLHERAEEMERMREHVFKENDKNKDGLIDFHEFMMETQRAEFNQDEGWKSIDENQIYTQAEYEAYERRRQDELRYLQQRGLVDAHGRPIPGAEHQIHLALQQRHAMEQQIYAQHQQQYQSHYPPGQQQFQQVPQQGQQFQQPPQGQQFQQPPQGQQFQQPPQGQQYQQPPQGQQYQQPLQGQQYQQPPQGQQYQQPPQGQQYQQPPQGQQYQQPPQQQQYQQVPQGQNQQEGQFQAQPPQGQNVNPGQTIPAQVPIQQAQGQNTQGQAPSSNQGQVPQQVQGQPQGQAQPENPSQGQAPPSVVNH
ncbi:nucleobindin-2-like [Aricia agestis]|uniref:nucleobindin-2-like n=1 Tax=Aricia agestis TaxID=91739 RepID=UPI001C2064BC|nr:nucleobindin-2-like [Aricia agestis]